MHQTAKRVLSMGLALSLACGLSLSSAALPADAGTISDDPLAGSTGTQLTTNPWTGNQAYAQYTDSKTIDGIVSTFQNSTAYSEAFHIPSDSVMVYADGVNNYNNILNSWQTNYTGKELCIMLSCNRAVNETEYNTQYGGSASELQLKSNYERIEPNGVPYIVPTQNFINYKWEIIKHHCENYNVKMVVLEEPEIWRASGYSDAFKAEWQAYYNEPWQDPASSTANQYKSDKLKVYLWERFISTLSERIKQNFPNVKVLVATHSTLSYNAIGIIPGLGHYTELPNVDGIIGQTWSNTVEMAVPMNGTSSAKPFHAGYAGYASFVDTVKDSQWLFTLADPSADYASGSWNYYEDLWKQTVVAQLMQPKVNRFQETIWLSRSFTPDVPMDYKTIQQNVFTALNTLSGKASALYAGTAGISVGLSDTIGLQTGSSTMASSNSNAGFYGITLPLIDKGIPVTVTSLDQVQSAADLQGVKVLLLSYDMMKPLRPEINTAIANWVSQGGTLLYLGGHDSYETVDGSWWKEQNQTPLKNLLNAMGLNNISVGTLSALQTITSMKWKDGTGAGYSLNGLTVDSNNRSHTATFSGSGFTSIFTSGTANVGIKAQVGTGNFIAIGLPSSIYSSVSNGATYLRDLVAYAVSFTDSQYVESNLMAVQRGRYIAAEALHAEETLNGNFVDIFDKDLPVITSKTVHAGSYALLCDISDLMTAGTPRFVHTGGTLNGDVTETASSTSFQVVGPLGSYFSTRILGNGKYPQSISVKSGNVDYHDYLYYWDNDTQSLLLQISDVPTKPLDVVIQWSDTPGLNPERKVYKDVTVATNSSNADSAFLIRNTANSNDIFRFCDLAGELVYKVDLSEYPDASILMAIFNNYKVGISDHDGDYTTLYDYSLISPDRTTGDNETTIKITPADYGITDTIYIRLSNTDITQGWGGGIRTFTVMYKENAHVPIELGTTITNNQNLDANFIVRNNGGANSEIRFCDLTNQLVYRFDLSTLQNGAVTLDVSQNYVLSVSDHDGNFTEVYNYHTLSGGNVCDNTSNRTSYTFSPKDYGYTDGVIYIMLSNTDVTRGWGGAVHQITIEELPVTYEPATLTVATNEQNLDAEFIARNSGNANPVVRFCDLGNQLVYRFDLNKYHNASITVSVSQNYILSYSNYDGNYTEAYNYYVLSGGERCESYANRTTYTFTPSTMGITGNSLYIMLSNTDVTKGWGGAIHEITINYEKPVA